MTDVSVRDLSAEVAATSARAEQLRSAQLKAEAQAQAADEEYSRAIEKLRVEFGVDSPEAARDLLERLDAQVTAELETVRAKLAEASDG